MPRQRQLTPPERVIEVQMPVKGIHRLLSYQQQPPYTTPEAVNVIPTETIEDRIRCGTRPGLEKQFIQNIGEPIFASELFARVPIGSWKAFTEIYYPRDEAPEFNVNTQPTGWQQASYDELPYPYNSPPTGQTFINDYQSISVEKRSLTLPSGSKLVSGLKNSNQTYSIFSAPLILNQPIYLLIQATTKRYISDYSIMGAGGSLALRYTGIEELHIRYLLFTPLSNYRYDDVFVLRRTTQYVHLSNTIYDLSQIALEDFNNYCVVQSYNGLITRVGWYRNQYPRTFRINFANLPSDTSFDYSDTLFRYNDRVNTNKFVPITTEIDDLREISWAVSPSRPQQIETESYWGAYFICLQNQNYILGLQIYGACKENKTIYTGQLEIRNFSNEQLGDIIYYQWFGDIEVPNILPFMFVMQSIHVQVNQFNATEGTAQYSAFIRVGTSTYELVNFNYQFAQYFASQTAGIPCSTPAFFVRSVTDPDNYEPAFHIQNVKFQVVKKVYSASPQPVHTIILCGKTNNDIDLYYAVNDDLNVFNVTGVTLPTENVNTVDYLQKLYIANPNGKPIVLDTATATASYLTASAGIVPENCPYIARFMDRIVLAGADHIWYMSRMGNPTDWDFAADPYDVKRAVAGQNSDPGTIGDPIIGILPFTEDRLLFFARNSIWCMVGNPTMGGRIICLSYVIGLLRPLAYTLGIQNEVYFISDSGLFVIDPNELVVKPISQETIPHELKSIPPDFNIKLNYDPILDGILILITHPENVQSNRYWFYHFPTGGFWRFEYPAEIAPIDSILYSPSSGDKSRLLLFCRDGFIRTHREYANTDDGYDLYSSLYLGAFNLSNSNLHIGLLKQLSVDLDVYSKSVTCSIKTGNIPQEAFSSNPVWTTLLFSGSNPTHHPRVSGRSAYIVLSSTNSVWAVDGLRITTQPFGVQRYA